MAKPTRLDGSIGKRAGRRATTLANRFGISSKQQHSINPTIDSCV